MVPGSSPLGMPQGMSDVFDRSEWMNEHVSNKIEVINVYKFVKGQRWGFVGEDHHQIPIEPIIKLLEKDVPAPALVVAGSLISSLLTAPPTSSSSSPASPP